MRVLVVERKAGLGDGVTAQLDASGHEVVRCHEPGTPAFPCNAIVDGEVCPLDHHAVDVAMAVRGDEGGPTTEDEDGVRCAIRRNVPVVLVGNRDGASYAGWTKSEARETDVDLMDKTAEAAKAGFDRHAAAARETLGQVLDTHDIVSSSVDVEIHRTGNRLRCVLHVDALVDPMVAQMAAVRVVVALRTLEQELDVIDVDVVDAEGKLRRVTP
ncbi:MAG TPA: hypothetical protein VIJ47_11285 [Acidimicrobiales bacterium]